MCHHSEIEEWEAIRERLDEPADELANEPAELEETPPEADGEREEPDVPTSPADD